MSVEGHGRSRRGSGSSVGGQGGVIGDHLEVRCSLPKEMGISRSEILRKKKRGGPEVEKLPSVKVLESPKTIFIAKSNQHLLGVKF